MGFAEGSEATLYVGKTTSEGVEPTTYETLTPTGVQLQGNQDTFQDESIDPSGKGLDTFRHSLRGGGAVNFHWRPSIFDASLESLLRGAFSTAFSETGLTASFTAPTAVGLQDVSDDGTGGVLGGLMAGDTVLIAGASNAGNNGLKRVVDVPDADTITVYNPGGATEAAAAGISIDHNGVATLGKTASWQWIELVHSDGSNNIYSEFYKDCVLASFNMNFPAGGATQCSLDYQGKDPTIVRADGSPPITKQRTGTDNPASTARLVHGMNDLRELVLYSPTVGRVVLQDRHNQFNFTISRNVRNDAAVGTPDIVNRGVSRPTIEGQINAYLTSAAEEGAVLTQFRKDNPDDLTMHAIFGANDTDAYGVFFDTVRVTAAPAPPGGNNAATLVNATFGATDVRVTRMS